MSEDREQKNAVFAQQAAQVQQRAAGLVQPQQAQQSNQLFETLTEVVPLPSAGLIYPLEHPFHGKRSIEIRAMTSHDEDILTSRTLLKKGTVLTELLRSCIIDKTVDPLYMLSGDRNALLVSVRITGYGHEYVTKIKCGNEDDCGLETERVFDLSRLEVKRLKLTPVAVGQNLFEFKLPLSKRTVQFKFLTGIDEQEMAAVAEKYRKMGAQLESNVTSALRHVIVSVDGITDRGQVGSFINNMRAGDSAALRKYIRDNEPGIDMKQVTRCDSCGTEEEVVIPITTQFLWPNASE